MTSYSHFAAALLTLGAAACGSTHVPLAGPPPMTTRDHSLQVSTDTLGIQVAGARTFNERTMTFGRLNVVSDAYSSVQVGVMRQRPWENTILRYGMDLSGGRSFGALGEGGIPFLGGGGTGPLEGNFVSPAVQTDFQFVERYMTAGLGMRVGLAYAWDIEDHSPPSSLSPEGSTRTDLLYGPVGNLRLGPPAIGLDLELGLMNMQRLPERSDRYDGCAVLMANIGLSSAF